MATNPFEELGLQWGQCTEEDVIRAHRRLALLNHPDRVGSVGVDRMKAINAARDTIIQQRLCSRPPPTEQRSFDERSNQRPSEQRGYSQRYDARPTERDYSDRHNPRPTERGYSESYTPRPSGRQNDSERYNPRPHEQDYSRRYNPRPSERQDNSERYTPRPSGRRDDSERYNPRPTERDYSERYIPHPSGRRDDSERYNPRPAERGYSESHNSRPPKQREQDEYSHFTSGRERKRDHNEPDSPPPRGVPGRWSPIPAARRPRDEADPKPRGTSTNIREVDEDFRNAMPSVMKKVQKFLIETRPRDTKSANTPWHTLSTLYHTLESCLPTLLGSDERVRICGLLGRLFFAMKLFTMWYAGTAEESNNVKKSCSLVTILISLDLCKDTDRGVKIPGWLDACLPDMERSWRQEAREHGI